MLDPRWMGIVALIVTPIVGAESVAVSGQGGLSAAARLDFSITIPPYLAVAKSRVQSNLGQVTVSAISAATGLPETQWLPMRMNARRPQALGLTAGQPPIWHRSITSEGAVVTYAAP